MLKPPRASGILLHPTSLPGKFGIGDLGPEAYNFTDFLASTEQTLWQILPLGPTGYGNSPYMCFSAFAGNPILISLEKLAEDGLLNPSDIDHPPAFPQNRVDYARVINYKMPLLTKSFQRFKEKEYPDDYYAFCQQNAFWLEDYSLFMALKTAHASKPWVDWPESLARREPVALAEWKEKLKEAVQFNQYVQFLFFKQWQSLRNYCHDRNIRIIGDMPIYVAYDSAEVWANHSLFYLDEKDNPIVVAGVPPDYFSTTGQRWGNPLYHWDLMAQSGYKWWIDRFRFSFGLVDILRLDHFRGFEAYWAIPAEQPTAVIGRWVKGPGAALFQAVKSTLGSLEIVAEDLGIITAEVNRLRDQFGFPGMKVLQFGFGGGGASDYLPHNYTKNCVVYTTTHDLNTTVGWFTAKPGTQTTQSQREIASRLARLPAFEPRVKTGYLRRYAEKVSSASTGAVFSR